MKPIEDLKVGDYVLVNRNVSENVLRVVRLVRHRVSFVGEANIYSANDGCIQ